MIYEIEPLDNLFFRNSAPFEAGGEVSVSHSLFPPLPSGYAGAFRDLISDQANASRQLNIKFSGLTVDGSFCLPMPQDLYTTASDTEKGRQVLPKQVKKTPLSSYPLPYMLHVPEAAKDKSRHLWYLSQDCLSHYLAGGSDDLFAVDINEKIVKETKLGIAIDYESRTSKEHHLYEIASVRPGLSQDIRLAVEVDSELSKESGVIRLGGEDKKARFRRTECLMNIKCPESSSKYFKLYLATPAIYRNGWLPGWINPETKAGYFSHKKKRISVKLISACIGRYIPCGGFGFDKEKRKFRPREMRYAVPPGCVYYFELTEGTFQDAIKLLHGKCVSDYRENMGFDYEQISRRRYCDRGYGYALVGALSKSQEEIIHV